MTNVHPAVISVGEATCGMCGAGAVVQWCRRLTAAEFAAHLATVKEARSRDRADRATSVDLELWPTSVDVTMAVRACADHAISLEAAAQIHSADCPAPHQDHLPACGCRPEPVPVLETPSAAEAVLPPSWSANSLPTA
ncbi:hypothetical protein [Streptomyces sp. NRRL S-350]|uniref:hypothetical protein n=1 Tax=Streptomyces sp. NRRL S-350 TaxID=1463902 RepID=UPI0004C2AB8D|nr:hypothetical protein [Streptomyces sp. NRRL S-350]